MLTLAVLGHFDTFLDGWVGEEKIKNKDQLSPAGTEVEAELGNNIEFSLARTNIRETIIMWRRNFQSIFDHIKGYAKFDVAKKLNAKLRQLSMSQSYCLKC